MTMTRDALYQLISDISIEIHASLNRLQGYRGNPGTMDTSVQEAEIIDHLSAAIASLASTDSETEDPFE